MTTHPHLGTTLSILLLLAAVGAPAQDWPGARGYAQSAFCESTGEILLFGGETDPRHGLTDAWLYSTTGGTWTRVEGAPAPGNGEGPMLYDPAADRVILHQAYNGMEDAPLALTWTFDPRSRTWTKLAPQKSPPKGIFGARMVYDREARKTILYGGEGSAQTWEFDWPTVSWKLIPLRPTPPSRNFHQMVYDAAGKRTLVWGGARDVRLWAYTYGAKGWSVLGEAAAPAPLAYAAMVLVPGLNVTVLHGGATPYKEVVTAETWMLDNASGAWRKLEPAGAPPARAWQAAAVDPITGKLYEFGGGSDRDHFTNELWVFDAAQEAWTRLGPPAASGD